MSHEIIDFVLPDLAQLACMAPGQVAELGVVPAGSFYVGVRTAADGRQVLRFERPGPVTMSIGVANRPQSCSDTDL